MDSTSLSIILFAILALICIIGIYITFILAENLNDNIELLIVYQEQEQEQQNQALTSKAHRAYQTCLD